MAKDKGAKAPKTEEKAGKKAKGGDTGGIVKPGTGGDNFTAKDEVGNLLLISPKGIEHDVVTTSGTSDATKANIVVLSDGKKPLKKARVIKDALIFQKILQSQVAEAIETRGKVCGRLFVDEKSKKAGQSAPYRLADPTEADIELAKAYLDTLNPLR